MRILYEFRCLCCRNGELTLQNERLKAALNERERAVKDAQRSMTSFEDRVTSSGGQGDIEALREALRRIARQVDTFDTFLFSRTCLIRYQTMHNVMLISLAGF